MDWNSCAIGLNLAFALDSLANKRWGFLPLYLTLMFLNILVVAMR